MQSKGISRFHLPGLFEFFDFYKVFLPLFYEHRDWFYDFCQIGSIYGVPADCLWGGGRAGFGQNGIERSVLDLCRDFGVSARLTFSNSLLTENHLDDRKCNRLCELFCGPENGIILHSDLLLDYICKNYPHFYFVSSTTKVLTDWDSFMAEVKRPEFSFVVPDFRLNKDERLFGSWGQPDDEVLKSKIEFLCNECCWFGCKNRRICYENVSQRCLGQNVPQWECTSPGSEEGYLFSKAKLNEGFIGIDDIREKYMPAGFSNFKIEGRSLGSALLLEFILYYMTKPEYQLNAREKIYLDNTLDLF